MKKKQEETSEWMGFDLAKEKQYSLLIKKLEFLIRKSIQYDIWQKRSKIGINECPICKESMYYLKPESHHFPETLFDVVDNILQQHIHDNDLDSLNELDIVQECLSKHNTNAINYIVLCKQCHEKYHDDVPDIVKEMPEAFTKQKQDRYDYRHKSINNPKGEIKDEK